MVDETRSAGPAGPKLVDVSEPVRGWAFLAVLLVLVGACRQREAPPKSAPEDSGTLSPMVATINDASARDASSPSKTPPSPEALAAHAASIAAGRTATKSGDAATAIKAFTDALQILPEDPQVLGERGFAKLKGGNDDGAREDFERAIALGGSVTLRAQLYFNVGLLEEKEGHREAAQTAFARSQRLHPTPAAAKKLASGTKVCPVDLDMPAAPKKFASWKDAARALLPDARSIQADSEARELLCADGCQALAEGRGLLLPHGSGAERYVIIEEGRSLYLLAVREWSGGGFKCPVDVALVSATLDRGIVRLDSTEVLCNTVCPTRVLVDCSAGSEGTRRSAAFWDLRGPKPLVRVTWDDALGDTSSSGDLTVADDGSLAFQGCDLHQRVPVPE